MNVVSLPILLIGPRHDARPVDQARVEELAVSMREVGLLNPITVTAGRRFRNGLDVDGWDIIAGQHRFRAARDVLNWTEVPCVVVPGGLTAELAMIDENLCRSELSPAERARQTARRKAIYEELHPETRAHVAGAHASNRAQGNAADNLSAAFADATAAVTGKDARTVRRDAERGEKIVPVVLDRVAGTPLDTGTYLDKLKGLDPTEQIVRVTQDLAAPASRSHETPQQASDGARELIEAWDAAPPAARELVRAWDTTHPDDRYLVRLWDAATPRARELVRERYSSESDDA